MYKCSVKKRKHMIMAAAVMLAVLIALSSCGKGMSGATVSPDAAQLIKQIETDTENGEGYAFDLKNDVFTGQQSDQEIGDYRISFFGEIGEFSGLNIGKGADDEVWAEHLQIDKEKIRIYDAENQQVVDEYPHGLKFRDYIGVEIAATLDGTAAIRLITKDGEFLQKDVEWTGRNGRLYAEAAGGDTLLRNCRLSYYCNGWSKHKWLYGDSYFSMNEKDRWTTYLLQNGASDVLLSGHIGEGSRETLEALKTQLRYGTPEIIYWCVGMNDGDSEDAVNSDYRECLNEVMEICGEKDIDLVLATIPTCPYWFNDRKNEYVKSLDYPYIDFADAVGSYESITWNAGMLEEAEKRIHPTETGAVALYNKAVETCPELLDQGIDQEKVSDES